MSGASWRNPLLALDGVCLVRLDAHNAALDKAAIVDDMVRLRGKHALDVVLDVAQDKTVAGAGTVASGRGWCRQRLDLETLKDGNRESGVCCVRVIEDSSARSNRSAHELQQLGLYRVRAYGSCGRDSLLQGPLGDGGSCVCHLDGRFFNDGCVLQSKTE